jgi:hypothetical protein
MLGEQVDGRAEDAMPFPERTDRPLDELLRLDGRIAVATGGALGIGRAICRRFSPRRSPRRPAAASTRPTST